MPIQSTAPAGSGPPSSGARRGVSALARAYGGAMMEREALEAATSAVASKSQYGGAATSVLGWLLPSEFTVVVGLLVAIGGVAVNWYSRPRRTSARRCCSRPAWRGSRPA